MMISCIDVVMRWIVSRLLRGMADEIHPVCNSCAEALVEIGRLLDSVDAVNLLLAPILSMIKERHSLAMDVRLLVFVCCAICRRDVQSACSLISLLPAGDASKDAIDSICEFGHDNDADVKRVRGNLAVVIIVRLLPLV